MAAESYTAPSVREILYAWLCEFTVPEVDASRVIWGGQNSVSLPAGSDDYLIFYTQSQEPMGTPWEEFDADEETLAILARVAIDIRVDCYACNANGDDGDSARVRATMIAQAWRSAPSCIFLSDYGVTPLFADGPQDTTAGGLGDAFVRRWGVTLHLSAPQSVTYAMEGFTEIEPVTLARLAESEEETGLFGGNIDVLAPEDD